MTSPPAGSSHASEGRPRARGRPGGPERRQAILDAAVRLFGERGFRSTGLHALAAEVGITHAGILHHFRSKEELLHALVQYRLGRQAQDYVPMLLAGGREGLAMLPRVAHALLTDSSMQRLFTVLISENLTAADPLHDHFVALQRTARALIASMVRAGVDNGQFRADIDTELIATEMIAFTMGMQQQWLLDPDLQLVATFEQYTAGLIQRLSRP